MAILTKPSVLKGVASQFSLNKSELLALSSVSNDPYFSEMLNWNRVSMIFKSSSGSQYEIVEFDATQESPIGHFLVSEKARDVFEILKIEIFDFDADFLTIPRSELTVEDFDISFSEGGEVTSALLSTDNAGDFGRLTTPYDQLLNVEHSVRQTFSQEANDFTYTYEWIFTLENATNAGLIDGNVYKLRFYFNSFSTEAPNIYMHVLNARGYRDIVRGHEALSSIQQFGYVDIPFQYANGGFTLGIYENTYSYSYYAGLTTFEISKMEVIE